jgi:AraC-like DNA-binding protein
MGSRFRKFFLTYIAFSAVTILIATIAYGLSYKVIRDASVESGQRDLEFSRRILEARIDDLYTTVAHLAASAEIADVSRIQRPVPYPQYYDVLSFQRTLPLFNFTSTFIDRVYVYFYDAGVIVSTTQVAIRSRMFYDHFFSHDEMSFDEWDRMVRSTIYRRSLLPRIRIGGDAGYTSQVRFYESFPLDSIRPRGLIMVHVREAEFMSYLGAIHVGSTGFVGVVDDDGRIVASSGNEETVERYLTAERRSLERDHVVLESTSPAYRLRFVAAIPTALFYEQVNLVGYVFLAIVALELLIGVVLGRYFAVRDMVPIRRLLDAVADSEHEPESRDEFELIAASFASMVHDNTALQDTVERQAPVIRSSFVEQLLSGKFEEADDIEAARRLAGIEFEKTRFAVCLVSVRRRAITSDDERRFSGQPIVQAVLDDRWRSTVGLDSYSGNIEPGTTAFLMNLDGMAEPGYRETLVHGIDELQQSFDQLGSVRVLVSCSETTDSLLGVPSLYSQAKTVHDYQLIMDESGMMFYSDIKGNRVNRALFDLDAETALTRSVIAGNREKTTLLLDELRTAVQEAQDLAPHSVELLLEQLEGALLRTIGALVFNDKAIQTDVRRSIGEARARVAFHERFARLQAVFVDLCEKARAVGRTQSTRVLEQMQDYLAEHHAEPQLGLNRLADAFGLSPGYASRFFKEHAGVGMAEYLERLRIDRATDWLGSSTDAIGDIAAGVGYTNPNTFYKAFRRIMGISAGEYRQRVQCAERSG